MTLKSGGGGGRGGVPCFLLDLAHLHVLPELGQAVMANCTCLFPRDCHGSGRLLTIRSKKKKKKETNLKGKQERQAFQRRTWLSQSGALEH